MSSLRTHAMIGWQAWGPYAKFTFCAGCGQRKYCRGKRHSKMLCLDCWDTGKAK